MTHDPFFWIVTAYPLTLKAAMLIFGEIFNTCGRHGSMAGRAWWPEKQPG
jgi:hypothetical protein